MSSAKRAGPGPSTQQKRTRFASPSPAAESSTPLEADESLLEADIPQGAARERTRARRQLKDQEGYESDSSNDEESVVPSRRAGKGGGDDEDMDMFAQDVVEEDKGKGKSKEKEFMDLKDVEGQEFGSRGDEYEEDDEEGRVQKRKEELDGDMGFEITPFNMKNEMDEGKFTADGESYVENTKDPNEKHDAWLMALDKEEILKARKAHEERERQEREKEDKEMGVDEDPDQRRKREESFMRDAVALMERGETVLEALQRLGKEVEIKKKKEDVGQQKKKTWAEKQKERKAMMAADQEAKDPTHTSNPFTNFSNIISGLSGLPALGQVDVYSLSRESIQRMLPAEAINGSANGAPTQPPPTDDRQFQYRFSLAYMRSLPEGQRPVEREIFGPFPVQQLRQWRGTGFFGGPACENVEIRKAGDEAWGSWSSVVEGDPQ